jgi:hypothetical protein
MRNKNKYNENDFIYYYLRDKNDHPRVSVCLFKAPNNNIYRGISLCSKLDVVNKKRGREIAKGRAIKAYVNKYDSEPITTDRDVTAYAQLYFSFSVFKSGRARIVTDYEKYLVGRKWQVEQN